MQFWSTKVSKGRGRATQSSGFRAFRLTALRSGYYDPSTGAFTSRDPLVSKTLQPYAYVGNDPLNLLDPTGLSCSWTSPWDCARTVADHVNCVQQRQRHAMLKRRHSTSPCKLGSPFVKRPGRSINRKARWSQTAKMTAKPTDDCELERTTADRRPLLLNSTGRWWMSVDASPAVFKTVCGLRNSKVCGLASRVFY
jgi:RHS repeat-associated protein